MSDERPTSAGVSRWEAAVRAVLRGDVASLDMHLVAAPDLIAQRGPEGRTLLSDAARAVTHDHALPSRDAGEEQHAVVAHLLAAGADPSAPEASGWTPLHSAAISGNERLARVLLDAGASVDALVEDRAGSTPLSYAPSTAIPLPLTPSPVSAHRRMTSGPRPDSATSRACTAGSTAADRFPGGADAGMDFYGPTEWFPPRQGPAARPTRHRRIARLVITLRTRRGDGAPRRPRRRRQPFAVPRYPAALGRLRRPRRGRGMAARPRQPTPTSGTTSAAKDTAPKPSPCTLPRNTDHSAACSSCSNEAPTPPSPTAPTTARRSAGHASASNRKPPPSSNATSVADTPRRTTPLRIAP